MVMACARVANLRSVNARAPSAAARTSEAVISKPVHFKEERKDFVFAPGRISHSGRAPSQRKAYRASRITSHFDLSKPCWSALTLPCLKDASSGKNSFSRFTRSLDAKFPALSASGSHVFFLMCACSCELCTRSRGRNKCRHFSNSWRHATDL